MTKGGSRLRITRIPALPAPIPFTWLSLAALTAESAGAQAIRGVVTDSANLTPLAAVLVTLADDSHRELQRALVDARGEFVFHLPFPGRYSVRAERIGMATRTIDRIEVAAGDTVSLRIALAQRPIPLEELRATGDGRCEMPADLGLATFRVWDEARKALAVADFASSGGTHVYELERYVRELEPGTLRIRTAAHTRWSVASERPMESLPVQDLVDGGWVVRQDGGDRYFARMRMSFSRMSFWTATACNCVPGTSRIHTWSGWSFARFGCAPGTPGYRGSSGCRAKPAGWSGSSSAI